MADGTDLDKGEDIERRKTQRKRTKYSTNQVVEDKLDISSDEEVDLGETFESGVKCKVDGPNLVYISVWSVNLARQRTTSDYESVKEMVVY